MIWQILLYVGIGIIGFIIGCVICWYVLIAAFDELFKR
jgi:hypothetical protein